MKYRELGSSGLRVSVVGLGTMSWPFCDYAQTMPPGTKLDRDAVKAMVSTALECGINLFDTAEGYGCGLAETLMGESLQDFGKRSEFIVVTKVGPVFADEQADGRACNLSVAHIISRCEGSLRRLRTDYIDLYLAHWPDPRTPLEETVGAMLKLKRAGKIRHFGVSNFSKELLQHALEHGEVAADQLPYNLLEREIEKDQVPFCLEKKIGIMAYSPLGKAVLTGKYNEDHLPPPGDYRHRQPQFSQENLPRHFTVARRCQELSRKLGITTPQLALAWCLAQPGVTTVLPGAKKSGQIRDNAGAAEIILPQPVLEELDALTC